MRHAALQHDGLAESCPEKKLSTPPSSRASRGMWDVVGCFKDSRSNISNNLALSLQGSGSTSGWLQRLKIWRPHRHGARAGYVLLDPVVRLARCCNTASG